MLLPLIWVVSSGLVANCEARIAGAGSHELWSLHMRNDRTLAVYISRFCVFDCQGSRPVRSENPGGSRTPNQSSNAAFSPAFSFLFTFARLFSAQMDLEIGRYRRRDHSEANYRSPTVRAAQWLSRGLADGRQHAKDASSKSHGARKHRECIPPS